MVIVGVTITQLLTVSWATSPVHLKQLRHYFVMIFATPVLFLNNYVPFFFALSLIPFVVVRWIAKAYQKHQQVGKPFTVVELLSQVWLPGILFKIRTLIAATWTRSSTWRLDATSSSVSFCGVETLLSFIIILSFVFAAFTLSEIHKIVDKTAQGERQIKKVKNKLVYLSLNG